MAREPKSSTVQSFIAGKDLRVMRIQAKYTTGDMADFMGVKSRKTIENWEQGASTPGINQFLLFCLSTDFNPWLVTREILKRNAEDPSQSKYFDLSVCRLQKKQ